MKQIPCVVMRDLNRYLDECDRREAYLAEIEKIMERIDFDEAINDFSTAELRSFRLNLEILVERRATDVSVDRARTELTDLFHVVKKRLAESQYAETMNKAAEDEAMYRWERLIRRCA